MGLIIIWVKRNKLIRQAVWMSDRERRKGVGLWSRFTQAICLDLKWYSVHFILDSSFSLHFSNSWCNKWSPRTLCVSLSLSLSLSPPALSSLAFWSPAWWETLKVEYKATDRFPCYKEQEVKLKLTNWIKRQRSPPLFASYTWPTK